MAHPFFNMKLIQKHLFKGTTSFEIKADRVDIHSQAPFQKQAETLTVMLSVLNPEPLIHRSTLDFVSRVNGEALISLSLGKPNSAEFNAFVVALKQKAQDEYNAFIGISSAVPIAEPVSPQAVIAAGGIAANVFEEPAEAADFTAQASPHIRQPVNVARLGEAIDMLERHLDTADLQVLMSALKALQAAPSHEPCFVAVVNAFNQLGFRQGAVLTYAPYISVLFSDDPFGAR